MWQSEISFESILEKQCLFYAQSNSQPAEHETSLPIYAMFLYNDDEHRMISFRISFFQINYHLINTLPLRTCSLDITCNQKKTFSIII